MFVKEPGAPEIRAAKAAALPERSANKGDYPSHLVDPTTVDGFDKVASRKVALAPRLPEHTVDL